MCGIIGIVGKQAVTPAIYDALTILQHRGQDAAGIATLEGYRLHLFKGNGLVSDVFLNLNLKNCRVRLALVMSVIQQRAPIIRMKRNRFL